ncbi:MAG: NADH:flavin oxidoreductase, partial [Pseudomonadota bacterium]
MTTLLTPFKIGSLELKNRVCMAPMTRNKSPNNVPGDDVVEYYRKRAEGDAALIITEGTCPGHLAASGYPDVPFFDGEDALAGWQKVIDAVHNEGGKIAPQLWHVGAFRRPGIEPGGDLPGYSPSGMLVPGKVVGHVMTQADIDETIAAYARAAKNAERLGADAVEIHGAHGYLIDEFFWAGTNQREDHYGGSMENRGRFAVEVIQAVRDSVSDDFPIILRWSQWKQQDFSARLATTPQELEAFLLPLSDAGVDIFHASQRRFWETEFDDSNLNLAGWCKKITGKPSMTVGSVSLDADFIPEKGSADFKEAGIASLDELYERLGNDEFDLVAVGRAMIANPNWAKKVAENRVEELVAYGNAANNADAPSGMAMKRRLRPCAS